MYDGIRVHWTMTFLGCISLVLVPGPFLLMMYGKKLRQRSQYATCDDQESTGEA